MDLDRFGELVRNSSRTKDELIQMRKNAILKGEVEFAIVAEEVLNERFPTWEKPRKSSGPTPTTAIFKSETRDFNNGKEAYIWLIEKLRSARVGLLDSQEEWHQRAFKGITRRYFADQPKALFPEGSKLGEKKANFEQLTGGWFANINLKHEQKFEILLRLSAICGLAYPTDWDFKVTGATISLVEKQKIVAESERLLNEVFNI